MSPFAEMKAPTTLPNLSYSFSRMEMLQDVP